MKLNHLTLLTLAVTAAIFSGCGKNEPVPPPAPVTTTANPQIDKAAQDAKAAADQAAVDAKATADKAAANAKATADKAAADAKTAADKAAKDAKAEADKAIQEAKAAAEKAAAEAKATVQAAQKTAQAALQQAETVAQQAQQLITQAQQFLNDKNPQGALDIIQKLASFKLTPEQQALVENLKTQAQKLLSSEAVNKATQKIGDLFKK